MSEILETAMLICFGFSWPINLVKNIKCKSAKGMSLPFILLLIIGYIAGISAKLITGRMNYVLLVYFLNLIIKYMQAAAVLKNCRRFFIYTKGCTAVNYCTAIFLF